VTFENPIWRIDDRLIHGQIIIGWCGQLPIKKLIVLDDEIAAREWEKNLMLMAAPPGLPTQILSVPDILSSIENITGDKKLTLILMKSPEMIKTLREAGLSFNKVNIGGIHFREDRKEFLPYVYLSENEIALFRELMDQGINFQCQDLPSSPVYDLKKIIQKKKSWK
jgi:mannose/fructose/N-acetylgalactosamine-specific phosphotransferase system component IIB